MMQTPKQSKKVTIDELAKMINRGFKEAHNDLIHVTSKMEERLNKRIDSVEGRLDSLEERFDSLDTKMEKHILFHR